MRFIARVDECLRVVDIVVFVCDLEDAFECFAVCVVDVVFVVVDDVLV